MVKNLPANAGDMKCMFNPWVAKILEEGMATHSSILAWRIPSTEEPGGYKSHGVTKSWTWLKWLSTQFIDKGQISWYTNEVINELQNVEFEPLYHILIYENMLKNGIIKNANGMYLSVAEVHLDYFFLSVFLKFSK